MRGIAFVLIWYGCWSAALPSQALAADPPAHAGPVVDKEDAERKKEQLAQEAQIAGVKLFKEGRYREAEDRFQTACVLVPAKANPYYWLARARMAQSRCAEGLVSLQEFFRLATPTNSNRGDAELRRRQCEQQLAAKARPPANVPSPPVVKAPPPKPTSPPPPVVMPRAPAPVVVAPVAPAPVAAPFDDGVVRDRSPRPGATKKIVGGVLIGVGVAAAVAGAVLGVGANGVASDVVNAAPGTPFDPALEESYRQGRASSVALLAAGGVVTAVGVVVLALGVRDGSRAPVALRTFLAPTRAGAALSLHF